MKRHNHEWVSRCDWVEEINSVAVVEERCVVCDLRKRTEYLLGKGTQKFYNLKEETPT